MSEKYPASPDAVDANQFGLAEVKCPYSAIRPHLKLLIWASFAVLSSGAELQWIAKPQVEKVASLFLPSPSSSGYYRT